MAQIKLLEVGIKELKEDCFLSQKQEEELVVLFDFFAQQKTYFNVLHLLYAKMMHLPYLLEEFKQVLKDHKEDYNGWLRSI